MSKQQKWEQKKASMKYVACCVWHYIILAFSIRLLRLLRHSIHVFLLPRRKKEQIKADKKEAKRRCIEAGLPIPQHLKKRRHVPTRRMSDPAASPIRVAIDLAFDDLMSPKDLGMVLKQAQNSYGVNRRADRPFQFYLTNMSGKFADLYRAVPDSQNWDVRINTGHHQPAYPPQINVSEKPYHEAFKPEDVVYLTSESPNTLTSAWR